MFDIAISSNYTVHNTYQDVFSWLKNRDPNETHVYSLKKNPTFDSLFLDFSTFV